LTLTIAKEALAQTFCCFNESMLVMQHVEDAVVELEKSSCSGVLQLSAQLTETRQVALYVLELKTGILRSTP
jgi:hypothetical protein